MEWVIGAIIVLAILLIISLFSPVFKYIMLSLLSVAQIIVFFYLSDLALLIVYGILGALSYMFLMGAACFDLDDKVYQGVIIEKIGNTIRIGPEEPQPLAAFFGSIFLSVIFSGGFILICCLFKQPIIMLIASAIVLLLSIISLIQHIVFWYT